MSIIYLSLIRLESQSSKVLKLSLEESQRFEVLKLSLEELALASSRAKVLKPWNTGRGKGGETERIAVKE